MNSVYYWSPCLTKVGTYKSTINSALSLAKYSKNFFSVKIINICGEWDSQKEFFNKNNIELIDLGLNYFKYLPKTGFFKSRLSYLIIILLSFIPMTVMMFKKKPKFLIIHLLTSLPLILNFIFRFKTNLILRISGYPKLNVFRFILWKYMCNKIHKITCPSNDLRKQLEERKVFKNSKLTFLPDPIIEVKKFKKKNNFKIKENDNKFFMSAGRLTKQKNFHYLIEEFSNFNKKNPNYDLYIFGDGEEKNSLLLEIKKKDLTNKVFLMGYSNEIYDYMKHADAFILSSLWEDPGFVIIEAAMNNLFIISSNCKNGPNEFLDNGKGGLLFENNKKIALSDSLNKYVLMKNTQEIFRKKIISKKKCKNYTLLNHQSMLNNILSIN